MSTQYTEFARDNGYLGFMSLIKLVIGIIASALSIRGAEEAESHFEEEEEEELAIWKP